MNRALGASCAWFTTAAIAYVLAIVCLPALPLGLRIALKALPPAVGAGWVAYCARSARDEVAGLVALAILPFGVAGDVVLELEEVVGEGAFYGGLACFGIQHLFVAIAYSQQAPVGVLAGLPWALVLAGVLVAFVLVNVPWPAFVYASVLGLAGWRASVRAVAPGPLAEDGDSFAAGSVAGLVVFAISDAVIAFDRFVATIEPLAVRNAVVMGLYFAAVGLLAFSFPRAR
jgi:alkylglycerol monooxygenase